MTLSPAKDGEWDPKQCSGQALSRRGGSEIPLLGREFGVAESRLDPLPPAAASPLVGSDWC